ncbi:reverse transcriptase domain-containing protein [Tanacetum coccineum]
MAKENEYKTTFYAPKGVFCYKKMPFRLKNAGATYQRLVDKVFTSQIGRNMEAYMDDMVIISMDEEDMLLDIKETFDRLQAINMKLNLKNVPSGWKKACFWDIWYQSKASTPTRQKYTH